MEQNIYELSDKYNLFMNVSDEDKEKFKKVISFAGETMELTIKERVREVQPRRGEIWTCNLGENVGSELNKTRPVIIISNNVNNSKSRIISIVPISKKYEFLPTHVRLEREDFVFTKEQIVGTTLAEHQKSISKARLGKVIGELTNDAIKKIENSIAIHLGISIG